MKFAKHHLLNLNKTTTCFKKPSKNDEKCFLFRLKNSFRSQDISVFVLNFSSDRKNDLIRKIKLVSKSMTSQLG